MRRNRRKYGNVTRETLVDNGIKMEKNPTDRKGFQLGPLIYKPRALPQSYSVRNKVLIPYVAISLLGGGHCTLHAV